MAPHAYVSSENTSPELKARAASVAVIPIGGTEQGGPKLPCLTDSMICEFCAQHYANALGAYLLPLMPFNTSQEHAAFHGTISLTAPLLTSVVTELVAEVARQGCNKVVIVSPHGGSLWLPAFIRSINHARRDLVVISGGVGADRSMAKALKASGWPKPFEMHGGLFSVASVSYLRPDLVRLGTAGRPVDPGLKEYASYMVWDKIAPDGAWGEFTAEDEKLDLKELARSYWDTFLREQSIEIVTHLKKAAELRSIPWD
jgi:creatinine amidohydrolase